MNLKELDLDRSYRSSKNNMVKDFYNPVLSVAKKYQRAVGYFTLSSLINASQGLKTLIDNGGVVEIIASPKLTEEDIETISLGYKMREDVYLDAMIREISNINSDSQKDKLNYIATLIADNRLDIKIAIMDDNSAYHEKFGIIEDFNQNMIMFTGSMNETENGQYNNFESFVVFKSWNPTENEYVNEFKDNFESLWNNTTSRLNIIPFPKILKEKLLLYKKEKIEKYELKDDELNNTFVKIPKLPSWFDPRPYQKKAIESWKNNDFKGLLVMATGTGKTLTGLYGMTELFNKLQKLVTIIVCPYQHLVEQWVDDVKKFNINPVVCYSKYDWRNQVYSNIRMINSNIIPSLTIVTTNSTFVLPDMQELLNQINSEILIIVDEAHNAGNQTMMNVLSNKFKYRLGLSATPKRFRDEESTDFIYNYFGGEVFNFDLGKAIEEGYLTKYYYYPHTITLTDEEQEKYDDLSLKIAQNIKEENGKIKINDFAKMKLIERARLVAGASNKLIMLRELLKNYVDTNYMLIYCGATKTIDGYNGDYDEERQIEKVCKILGNEFNITNHKFTAEESIDEREEIINMFSDGRSLQAIVAIKCLDEGVNIPAIQHAFILASNTDPKEFIQRRGRVLRLYEKNGVKKEFAYIHDFVCLPNGIENSSKLVESELKRVYEFNSLAENKLENDEIIDDLVQTYNIEFENITSAKDEYAVGGLDDDY